MEVLPKNLICADMESWLKPSYEYSLENDMKKCIEEGEKELEYLVSTPFMIPACMRSKDDELCVEMKFEYMQSKKDGLACSGDTIFGIRAYLADTPDCSSPKKQKVNRSTSSPTDCINVQVRLCRGTAVDKLPLEMEGSSSIGSTALIVPQSGESLFTKWQIIREEFATEAKCPSQFAHRFAKMLLFISVPDEAVPKAIQELCSVLDAAVTPDWQPHLAHLDIYVLTMIDPDFDYEPPVISADVEKYALWDD